MITIQQIINGVRKKVAESPDFVYDRQGSIWCKYVPDHTQPGCIFGQVLIDLGMDKYDLYTNNTIDVILDRWHIHARPLQISWCREMQIMQDRHNSWSKCLELADNIAAV